MIRSRFHHTLTAAITAAVALLSGPGPVSAEAPADVERWFAQKVVSTDPCLDWEAQDSKRIVAHRDGNSGEVIRFITPDEEVWFEEDAVVRDADGNVLIDLSGTAWTQMPVIHVTESGVEQVQRVYWLQQDDDGDLASDPVPSGLTTQTGATGDVLMYIEVRIEQGLQNGALRYYISPSGSEVFCVAVGQFQK